MYILVLWVKLSYKTWSKNHLTVFYIQYDNSRPRVSQENIPSASEVEQTSHKAGQLDIRS